MHASYKKLISLYGACNAWDSFPLFYWMTWRRNHSRSREHRFLPRTVQYRLFELIIISSETADNRALHCVPKRRHSTLVITSENQFDLQNSLTGRLQRKFSPELHCYVILWNLKTQNNRRTFSPTIKINLFYMKYIFSRTFHNLTTFRQVKFS